jgi:hypothetical protein
MAKWRKLTTLNLFNNLQGVDEDMKNQLGGNLKNNNNSLSFNDLAGIEPESGIS